MSQREEVTHLPPVWYSCANDCADILTEEELFWAGGGKVESDPGWYCDDCVRELDLVRGVCLDKFQELPPHKIFHHTPQEA